MVQCRNAALSSSDYNSFSKHVDVSIDKGWG